MAIASSFESYLDADNQPQFARRVTAGIPRLFIVPTIASVLTGRVRYGDGTNDIYYMLATFNAGDDFVASARFEGGFPDVEMFNLPASFEKTFDASIFRVDVLAVGEAISASQVTIAATQAQIRTAMTTYLFSASDKVRALQFRGSERFDVGTTVFPAVTAHTVDLYLSGGA